ncbi:MAG: CPBP family intramembrane glutamic endopeptidase [Candidatus Eisenbacteria bacterium]
MLVTFGVGGVLLGQQELALLAAIAGIFVAARAADSDPGWRELYSALGWVVPTLGFVMSLAVGAAIWQSSLPDLARGALVLVSACVAGLAILTVPTPVANTLARALFRDPQPGHVLRLSARMVVLAIAIAVPGWFAAQLVMEEMLGGSEPFMDRVGLGGGLIGYVLLAFAGVGLLIRRNFAGAAIRLGLAWPGGRDLLVGVVTLGALWALNTGADLLQQRFLPELWASDRRVTEAIAAGLTPGRAVLLGLSAGIGEEITLRGALQPRLGILLTSVFFAALHVQYSWFGMLVILVLGALLGLVRQRTNTTVAIMAHVAYDVVAVMTN